MWSDTTNNYSPLGRRRQLTVVPHGKFKKSMQHVFLSFLWGLLRREGPCLGKHPGLDAWVRDVFKRLPFFHVTSSKLFNETTWNSLDHRHTPHPLAGLSRLPFPFWEKWLFEGLLMVVGDHCHFRSSLYELSLFRSSLQIWGWEESSAVCSWISPRSLHTENITTHWTHAATHVPSLFLLASVQHAQWWYRAGQSRALPRGRWGRG